MNKSICVQDLGLKDYKTTWDFQEELFKNTVDCKIKNRRQDAGLSTPNHFLFVSHPHVYTLGKSGDFSNLLLNEDQLTQKGATFYWKFFGIGYNKANVWVFCSQFFHFWLHNSTISTPSGRILHYHSIVLRYYSFKIVLSEFLHYSIVLVRR